MLADVRPPRSCVACRGPCRYPTPPIPVTMASVIFRRIFLFLGGR